MNPSTDPPRASSSCTRHPDEPFTSFCPSCLCERLAVLEPSSAASAATSSSRKPPALKSLFYLPELRRSKSFSAARNDALSLEPQRRSCDVRAHNPEIEIEIGDEIGAREIVEEVRAMKDYIDLDSQSKRVSSSSIVGSFWTAASVLSKKLQKWRKTQNPKRPRNGVGSAALPVEKPIGSQFRDTQSEIADYGFGRRSCDADPRFSLDDRRISFDDARYSVDEPRASWDGHLIGRSFPRLAPMLSVVEDAPPPRPDAPIPIEESPPVPGGSAQTREYYDSSSRRRRSFDRSASFRKAVVGDEAKPSTAKVSPATTTIEGIDGPKLEIPNSISNSNCPEAFEIAFRDHGVSSFPGNGVRRGSMKKSRRWGKGWSIWGLINRRGGGGGEEDEEDNGGVVQRSLSESWRGGGGDRKVCRSNSSVSFRNSSSRSGRWESPGNVEGGMLRFYLTPLRGSRRNGNGRTGQAQSIARSVLRLY